MSGESDVLWSVRMHASTQGEGYPKHLSGSERLVADANLAQTVAEMLARGQVKKPDTIRITTERITASACAHTNCLPITTVAVGDTDEAADLAQFLLIKSGVAPDVAAIALQTLTIGLKNDRQPMRGASLWDMATAERLEEDVRRGIRTSRFDYSEVGTVAAASALESAGLCHYRTREAVAVASKNIWAGIAAEICWSDEQDYNTGYVSSAKLGYIRIPGFKPKNAVGGRIYFIDPKRSSTDETVRRLEREYVLIDPPIVVYGPISVSELHQRL